MSEQDEGETAEDFGLSVSTQLDIVDPLANIYDLSTVCRICAHSTEPLLPIFGRSGTKFNIGTKINNLCPIKVVENDYLPQCICQRCCRTLLSWERLLETCVEADAALKNKHLELNNKDNSKAADQSLQDIPGISLKCNLVQAEDDKPEQRVVQAFYRRDTIHSDKNCACTFCQINFGCNMELVNHILSVHSDLRFQCQYCDVFFTRIELFMHMSLHAAEFSMDERNITENELEEDSNYDPYNYTTNIVADEQPFEHYDILNDYQNFGNADVGNIRAEIWDVGQFKEQMNIKPAADTHESAMVNQQNLLTGITTVENIPIQMNNLNDLKFISTSVREIQQSSLQTDNNQMYSVCYEMNTDNEISDMERKEKCNAIKYDEKNIETNAMLKKNVFEFEPSTSLRGSKDIYITSNQIEAHTVVTQSNKTTNVIKACDKAKKSKSVKKNRLRSCPVCGKEFLASSSYFYHIKFVHVDVKEHTCEICYKKFSSKNQVQEHESVHTGHKVNPCTICKKAFRSKSSLYIHNKNVHSNEAKSFVCTECNLAFRWKHKLLRHIVTHSKEKTLFCTECKKGFKLRCDLTRHMKTHSTLKLYRCTLCPSSFAQRRYLKNHMHNMHSDKKK